MVSEEQMQGFIQAPSPQAIKKFHAQVTAPLSMINTGILTFISMINTTSESFKARKVYIFRFFLNEQLIFYAQLSRA